jgi:hypothetical protein
MSKGTYERYLNILSLMEFTEPETDEFLALSDEMMSLPGHPRDLQPNEYLKPRINSVQH